ncbi:FAD-dependent oxidoreductase [Acinetobacter bereziniae]|uniref:FAD-dependent oxidoreductase n=1 Tax=Acinetobacter bereziniae TaxID=106648 RepID=UPI0018DC1D36|nr:FAD-dependent oxidoreductase [Acinetobacter bereziniae]MBI0395420.1 FAD-dependent oxidoreductase [Acinetobacter bereziniae]
MTGIVDIAIVGGGIGGMCAAIQLKKLGKNVSLIEIKDTLKPIGAGITLSAATLRALKEIGVVQDLFKVSGQFSQFDMYTSEGHKIAEAPIKPAVGAEDLLATSIGVMRTKFAEVLEKRLRELGVNVILGTTIDQLENLENTVKVTLNNGIEQQFDLVIGADGLHSKIRHLVFPNIPESTFTHQGAWRIVVPKYFNNFSMMIGKTLKASFSPISDTQSYMCVLDHRENDDFIEQHLWPEKLSELLAEFGSVVQEIKSDIDQGKITAEDILYRPLHTLLVEESWHKGRVVLLGDAVHSTTPHLASGAGLAIEGAILLAEELAKNQTLEQALTQYQQRHFERAKMVINVSTRLGEIEMSNGSPIEHRELATNAFETLTQPLTA